MIQLRNAYLVIMLLVTSVMLQAQSTPADFRYIKSDTTQTDSINPNIASKNLNVLPMPGTMSNSPQIMENFANGDIQPHIPTSYPIDKNCIVGDIPYTFNISQTGAATMTIPIECYKSQSGFDPNIALSYNSQGGIGPLGWGWSISGASVITACNKTWYYDGKAEGISHNSLIKNFNNSFTLDGMRLILIKEDALSKHFESQQGMIKATLRLKASGGTISVQFEVFYPDGRYAQYNLSDIYSYYITKEIDKAGNEIKYEYNYQQGHYRLSSIKYSKNASIDFNYTNNTDPNENTQKFIAGTKMVCDYKLTSIVSKINGLDMNTYSLKYKPLNNYKYRLLDGIYCKNSNENKNHIQLFYGEADNTNNSFLMSEVLIKEHFDFKNPYAYRVSRGRLNSENENDGLLIFWDKVHYNMGANSKLQNGYNGAEEIVIYNGLKASTTECSSTLQTGKGFIDAFCMNTDEEKGDEIIKINNYKENGIDKVFIHVYTNKNNWQGALEKYVRECIFTEIFYKTENIMPKYYYPGDYNGDGKMELLIITRGEGSSSRIKILDLDSNRLLYDEISPITFYTNIPSEGFTGDEPHYMSDRIYAIDYNGDGKTELCHINEKGTNVYQFYISEEKLKCGNVVKDTQYTKELLRDNWFIPGDYNGDGKSDFILPPKKDSQSMIWSMFLSKGNGYFDKTDLEIAKRSTYDMYFAQDVDLDGQHDIIKCQINIPSENEFDYPPYTTGTVYMLRDGIKVYKSPFFALQSSNMFIPINIQSVKKSATILAVNTVGKITKIDYSKINEEMKLLAGFADGNGIVSKMKYGQLFNTSSYYSTLTDAIFPYMNYTGSFRVCHKIQKYNQGYLLNDLNYEYTNAVIHRQGLGFCGFSLIKTNDNKIGNFRRQSFDPYRFGIPVSDSSNTEDNSYTFNLNIAPNKLTKAQLTAKINSNKVVGGTTSSTYLYDEYGNCINEVNDPGEGLISYSNTQYLNVVNDSTNIIGLPTRVEKTNTRKGNTFTNITEFAYNNSWFPTITKQYTNGNKLIKEEHFEYDNINNLIQSTYKNYNSEWFNTKYGYSGRTLLNKTDELGHVESYTYDTKGNLNSITDYKGNKTSFSYDNWGRKIETVYPDSLIEKSIATWAKDVPEALIKIETTATGKPTKVAYLNALKQEIRTGEQRFDGKYLYFDKQYDIKGRLVKVSQPFKTSASQWDSFTYDDFDRTLATTYASGRSESNSYSGRNVTSTVAGISTTRKYDAIGTLTSVIDPGGEITYEYRPDNQLRSITAPGGVVTSFNYDEYGRQTAINDPSAGLKQFAYDNAGNVNCETDARGKTVKSTHDRFNRVTKREYDGGLTIDYVYNEDGKLLSATDSKRKRNSFKYDHLSRVIEEKDSIYQLRWYKKNYHYGKGSVITDIDHTDKLAYIATENYKYSNGHPTEITLNDTIPVWKLSEENAKGLSTQLRTGPLYRSYAYDDEGRTNSRFVYLPDADIQLLRYKYNSITGNMEWREDGMHNKKEFFGYDNLNRLTSFGANTVQYATNGNITSMSNVGSFTYEGAKPYAIATATPTHDLIPIRDQHIVYNAMLQPDTIREGKLVGSFNYFGDGRRSEMRIQRSGYSLQRYYMGDCYETDNLVVIRTVTEQRKLYVGGDYYSAPAVLVKTNKGAWKLHYIMRDNLGSITHVTDAAGNLVQELSYDPWGNIRDPKTHIAYATDSVPVPFLGRGFTGHEHLQQFGLINMNGRLYDPALGRFLSPDPYVQMPDFTQNFNRFSYCLNNPLIYKDENGEFILSAIFGFWKGIFTGENPFKTAWQSVKNEALMYAGLFTADSNKGFFGQAWEIISRITWQLPQTTFGLLYSRGRNYIGMVDDVQLYRGATYVIDEYAYGSYVDYSDDKIKGNGITLGSYININDEDNKPMDENGKFDPTQSQLYMHEYGHYLQSQDYGVGFIPIIGIPSLISSLDKGMRDAPYEHISKHNGRWYERDANKRASMYFGKYNNVNWNESGFPIELSVLNLNKYLNK